MPLQAGATFHRAQPIHSVCVLRRCQHFCSRQKRSRLFSCSGGIGGADSHGRFKKWVHAAQWSWAFLRQDLDFFSCCFCSFSPVCDRTLLGKKVKKRNCLELYEFQDGDWRPATVSSSTKRKYTNESKLFSSFYPFINRLETRNKWVFCSFCCSDEELHLLSLLRT